MSRRWGGDRALLETVLDAGPDVVAHNVECVERLTSTVRDAKAGVLNCLRPLTLADIDRSVVRGQYIEGDMHGRRVPGYRKEVRDSFASMGKALPS